MSVLVRYTGKNYETRFAFDYPFYKSAIINIVNQKSLAVYVGKWLADIPFQWFSNIAGCVRNFLTMKLCFPHTGDLFNQGEMKC